MSTSTRSEPTNRNWSSSGSAGSTASTQPGVAIALLQENRPLTTGGLPSLAVLEHLPQQIGSEMAVSLERLTDPGAKQLANVRCEDVAGACTGAGALDGGRPHLDGLLDRPRVAGHLERRQLTLDGVAKRHVVAH